MQTFFLSMMPRMPIQYPKSSKILSGLQDAAKRQGTNPYQIAKSSGLPLTTVQRLLTIRINVPLRNVEMLMDALGLTVHLQASGKPITRPATGRAHGRKASSRR